MSIVVRVQHPSGKISLTLSGTVDSCTIGDLRQHIVSLGLIEQDFELLLDDGRKKKDIGNDLAVSLKAAGCTSSNPLFVIKPTIKLKQSQKRKTVSSTTTSDTPISAKKPKKEKAVKTRDFEPFESVEDAKKALLYVELDPNRRMAAAQMSAPRKDALERTRGKKPEVFVHENNIAIASFTSSHGGANSYCDNFHLLERRFMVETFRAVRNSGRDPIHMTKTYLSLDALIEQWRGPPFVWSLWVLCSESGKAPCLQDLKGMLKELVAEAEF